MPLASRVGGGWGRLSMLADDVFRAQLRRTIAHLRSWAETCGSSAHVEEDETSTYWRLRVTPEAANACPFELILHMDQHCDLAVGPEVYEHWPIESLALIAPLVAAIAAGRVVTRTWVSRNTDAVRSVESIITLPDGSQWRRERLNQPLAAVIDAEQCEAHDHPYAPYRLA